MKLPAAASDLACPFYRWETEVQGAPASGSQVSALHSAQLAPLSLQPLLFGGPGQAPFLQVGDPFPRLRNSRAESHRHLTPREGPASSPSDLPAVSSGAKRLHHAGFGLRRWVNRGPTGGLGWVTWVSSPRQRPWLLQAGPPLRKTLLPPGPSGTTGLEPDPEVPCVPCPPSRGVPEHRLRGNCRLLEPSQAWAVQRQPSVALRGQRLCSRQQRH